MLARAVVIWSSMGGSSDSSIAYPCDCWKEFLIIGLFQCPQDSAVDFPQSQWFRRAKENHSVLYDPASEVALSFIWHPTSYTSQPFSKWEETTKRHEYLEVGTILDAGFHTGPWAMLGRTSLYTISLEDFVVVTPIASDFTYIWISPKCFYHPHFYSWVPYLYMPNGTYSAIWEVSQNSACSKMN